ncbi:TPA: hypothetical protein EYP44_01040, partial [Candidatus Bathyarchaeota archaeon]|nr:hypothetical protein [Candidatus Bathyarchaeota archaeon]
ASESIWGSGVITDDDRLAERVRSLINHCRPSASPMPGVHPSSVFVGLGYNYRMAEVQGALAIGQIRKLDRFNKAREDIANLYRRGLEEVTGIDPPYVAPNVRHAWYMFVCTVNRDEVRVPLNRLIDAINAEFCVAPGEERVQRAATRGTLPIYFQPILAEKLGYGRTGCPFTCPIYGREVRYEKGMCPNAESLYETSLSLFINHAMSPRDAMDIVRAIRKVSAAYTRGS